MLEIIICIFLKFLYKNRRIIFDIIIYLINSDYFKLFVDKIKSESINYIFDSIKKKFSNKEKKENEVILTINPETHEIIVEGNCKKMSIKIRK